MVAGDSVGIMPQGPGQQPMGPAQLAALLRCVGQDKHQWVVRLELFWAFLCLVIAAAHARASWAVLVVVSTNGTWLTV